MPITNATSTFGCSCKTQAASTLVSGASTLGNRQTVVSFANANIGYAIRSVMSQSANYTNLNVQTGVATGTAGVTGVAQVETATVVGGCTANDTCTVTITSDALSPSTFPVIVNLTTASNTATKVATALAAAISFNAAVSAVFTVTSSGANLIFTRKLNSDGNYPATDASLNVAISASSGITAAPTSTDTTAGTATTGTFIYDADGKDFEGVTLASMLTLYSLEINVIRGSASASNTTDAGTHVFPLPAKFWFPSGNTGALLTADLRITALQNGTEVTITVLGKST